MIAWPLILQPQHLRKHCYSVSLLVWQVDGQLKKLWLKPWARAGAELGTPILKFSARLMESHRFIFMAQRLNRLLYGEAIAGRLALAMTEIMRSPQPFFTIPRL